LHRYTKEFVRPPHPEAKHLRCFARLDDDISEVLPYLHTALKGHQYFPDTPSLTLKYQDRLITLYPQEIHINIVKDAEEAEVILTWLHEAINHTWREKETIRPSWEATRTPPMLPILKLLPRTNCRQCGETTCLVFAQQVAAGEKYPADCPANDPVSQGKLEEYLQQFFQGSRVDLGGQA
jgi:ArsR family metal-binding transcriptional regulator